tara:strand:- start:983 stop:1831 length:849 start_codon:yes stop_codon:yes gene_type:complete
MNISCSARKDWQYHIRDWLDFQRSYAKIHSNFEFDYDDIDYAFGQPEGDTKLFGGRTAVDGFNISRVDAYWLYDHNIGIKITLSTKLFNDDMYKKSRPFLQNYHRKGNAIITSSDKLAKRIKEDFPEYKLEASCIQDIVTVPKLKKNISLGLYDTIVLPIHMNDDIKFLKKIKDKKQIRLFLNVECSYTCPKKVCYNLTSKINAGEEENKFKCSFWNLGLERTFYNDDINWSEYYFDKSKFDKMGFSKYKLVPPWESQQRTFIMYEKNKSLGGGDFQSYVLY